MKNATFEEMKSKKLPQDIYSSLSNSNNSGKDYWTFSIPDGIQVECDNGETYILRAEYIGNRV